MGVSCAESLENLAVPFVRWTVQLEVDRDLWNRAERDVPKYLCPVINETS